MVAVENISNTKATENVVDIVFLNSKRQILSSKQGKQIRFGDMKARRECVKFSYSLNKTNAKKLADEYHKNKHKGGIEGFKFFLNMFKLVSNGT